MTPTGSQHDTLTLHALRLTGMGDARAVADRFALPVDEVSELLLDFEAYGWVRQAAYTRQVSWTLTEAGRRRGEQLLGEELAAADARPAVERVHTAFLPLNARLQSACTAWQIRPLPGQPLAANDHTDARWDDRVIRELATLGGRLSPLCRELSDRLARFDGYADRFRDAIVKVERGERSWVADPGIDSAHAVWFELHEDLIATLGLERGA